MNLTNKEISEFFWDNNLKEIKEYCGIFSRKAIISIMNNDYKELDKILIESEDTRAEIEYNKNVDRNKEFYYGYMVAYENIIKELVEENEKQEKFHNTFNNDNLFKKVFMYIGEKGVVNIEDISKDLKIEIEDINKSLFKYDNKELNVFYTTFLGKHGLCELSLRGQDYYEKLKSIE